MPSIKEIAAQAGVSITAVSEVLNNYPDVGENTRTKVREVAERILKPKTDYCCTGFQGHGKNGSSTLAANVPVHLR